MDQQDNTNMGSTPSGGLSGSIIAVIVILIIIILGGLYFWNQRAGVGGIDELDNSSAVESINTQSSSDEAAVIEADLNATKIENLDADLNTP